MAYIPKQRNIAYRCPGCGSAVIGLVGKFALHANMLRLKCSCGDEQSLDINLSDSKVRLSVPCLFCRQNHSYVVSESLFFENDRFLLNCPYSNMDIAFIGDEDTVGQELSRTEAELNMLMKDLEAEELSDIQPEEMTEAEIKVIESLCAEMGVEHAFADVFLNGGEGGKAQPPGGAHL